MARLAGYGGNVKVATAAVAGIRAWSLDYIMNVVETTAYDSSGHKVFIPTIDEWSGSFEGFKDGAPLSIGTEIALELEESSTANQEWTGQAIITAVHPASSTPGSDTTNTLRASKLRAYRPARSRAPSPKTISGVRNSWLLKSALLVGSR